MESIRNSNTRSSLRKTSGPIKRDCEQFGGPAIFSSSIKASFLSFSDLASAIEKSRTVISAQYDSESDEEDPEESQKKVQYSTKKEREKARGNAVLRGFPIQVIRPDGKDINKLLNFETDDETTDAESIFSRQTSRDDILDGPDLDDLTDDLERKKNVARGEMERRCHVRYQILGPFLETSF